MINYGLWDLKKEFTLKEVTWLWFELDPYAEKTSSRELAPVYKLWLILRVFLTCRIEEKTCNVLEYI